MVWREHWDLILVVRVTSFRVRELGRWGLLWPRSIAGRMDHPALGSGHMSVWLAGVPCQLMATLSDK